MGCEGECSFSVLFNLYASISHRFPNPLGATVGQFDILNNVVYNWRYRWVTLGSVDEARTAPIRVNFVNNYYKQSDFAVAQYDGIGYFVENANKVRRISTRHSDFRCYTAGTVVPGFKETGTEHDHEFWRNFNHGEDPSTQVLEPEYFVQAPHEQNGRAYEPLSAADAYTSVEADVGANAYLNDAHEKVRYEHAVDEAVLTDVRTGTADHMGGTDYVQQMLFDTHAASARPANFDSDNDGMPDDWETATFGTLARDGKGDEDGDGYTDVEEYLNLIDGDATIVEAAATTVAAGSGGGGGGGGGGTAAGGAGAAQSTVAGSLEPGASNVNAGNAAAHEAEASAYVPVVIVMGILIALLAVAIVLIVLYFRKRQARLEAALFAGGGGAAAVALAVVALRGAPASTIRSARRAVAARTAPVARLAARRVARGPPPPPSKRRSSTA